MNLDGSFNARGLRRYRLVMPDEKPHIKPSIWYVHKPSDLTQKKQKKSFEISKHASVALFICKVR